MQVVPSLLKWVATEALPLYRGMERWAGWFWHQLRAARGSDTAAVSLTTREVTLLPAPAVGTADAGFTNALPHGVCVIVLVDSAAPATDQIMLLLVLHRRRFPHTHHNTTI